MPVSIRFAASLLGAALLAAAPALAAAPHGGHGAKAGLVGPAWTMARAEGAWVREAPPTATALAGYLTVVNPSAEALTLVGATSPQFASVEMHEIVVADGLTKMQQVKQLVVPAGGKLAFAPGATHLMLMGPKQPLKAGAPVEIVLQWAPKGKTTVRTAVRGRDAKPASAAPAGHEHHH